MRPGYTAGHVTNLSRGRGGRLYVACLWTVIVAAVLAACDVPDEEVPVAGEATPGEATPGEPLDASSPGERAQNMPSDSIAARFLAETRFVNAEFERGELLSYACIVCHSLGPGEGHLIGPNLNGIFGRPAASSPDFPYSDALREADIVWTPAELDAWLARPDDFVPGNLMVFAGIYSVSDRTDLLAYLLRETAVEAATTAQ